MIARAASFIARTGPATSQDRWEETAGLTPSTLAPVVAALVVAAGHLPEPAAAYCLELADDWNASIEDWTYARGTRLAREHGVDGHYVRIASPDVLAGAPLSTPVTLRNRPPGSSMVPGDEMVGTDFLALVRFGLRLPDDPRIVSSLAVADALLRTETPSGPVWHRYNGDGYGEHEDGSAYDGTGIGRGWPLLVGERGHYELDAGRDARPYLDAMRRMASGGGMLPEQVWDAAPIPERHLAPGRPSGSAMPLAWAHAEYVKLVRSIALGHSIDRPEAAWRRYRGIAPKATRATWRFTAPRPSMPAGRILRLELMAPARVRYSTDGWQDLDRPRCPRHGPRCLAGRRARVGPAGSRRGRGLHVLVAGGRPLGGPRLPRRGLPGGRSSVVRGDRDQSPVGACRIALVVAQAKPPQELGVHGDDDRRLAHRYGPTAIRRSSPRERARRPRRRPQRCRSRWPI